MIQFGARRGLADFKKLSQSWRLCGEKSFVPEGQLVFSVDFDTSKQFTHFTTAPGE
jgi:hypothetical protein